ncbi:MAG TPA: hypothetical protein VEI82_14345 [Myxococcota bacterium]|nr:hypothetical protein [Myxococcota bacterium]
MKKLSAASFARARAFVARHARPLERAQLAREFDGAPARVVLDALAAFRNPDDGFGRALEPDLRLPDSSALATQTALDLLRELDAPDDEPLLRGALRWLEQRFDPEIPGWRAVPANVDSAPHAPHWAWALHRPGGSWDHVLIPGARILAHWSRWRRLAPREPMRALAHAVSAHVTKLTPPVGADTLVYAASVEDSALRARLRELARASVSRDPAEWSRYVAKPLKLAPLPDSPLVECLAAELPANLDWEIEHQCPDGSWLPSWDWQGQFPADWEVARREWQGEITLRTLRSLRAFGRIEGR